MTETMTAVVQDEYGPDAGRVLRLERIDRPTIGDDEVLVRVAAAGVDRGVWHVMAGLPLAGRLAFGLRSPNVAVPGRDLAGTVEAVGAGVTGFAPGDEVFGTSGGTRSGSFAEYAAARADRLALKPTNLSFEQAAAVPVSALTALQGVRDEGRVEAGQSVAVVGASGGVGTYAVQLAKAFGAEVTGVCSTAKVDLVRALGADRVVDYTREDFADGGPYDVIIDIGGNASVRHLRGALTPRGRLVITGGEGGGRWLGVGRQVRATLLSPFVGQKLGTYLASENADDLVVLRDLVESGKIVPEVERTYPLAEAATAIQHMVDGQARGKLVLLP